MGGRSEETWKVTERVRHVIGKGKGQQQTGKGRTRPAVEEGKGKDQDSNGSMLMKNDRSSPEGSQRNGRERREDEVAKLEDEQ